jgi:uncharacterized repeat protein (TIGR03803 family)
MALQHAIQLEHACIPTYLYALYSIKPDQKQGDCRSPSLGHAGRNAAHRADGGTPAAGVIRDSTGNLYGTTTYGGVANEGVVYKLGTTGQEMVLHSFTGGADGGYPEAGVIRDSTGNLYGTTTYGETGLGVGDTRPGQRSPSGHEPNADE